MKKLIFAGLTFCLILIGSLNVIKAEEPGPFLKQGHCVPLANGGAECMTHWWNNDCKVGDIQEPGSE
jgi:hypothetical protein